MKNQLKILFLVIALVLGTIGCSQKDSDEKNIPKETKETDKETDKETEKKVDPPIENEEKTNQNTTEKKAVTIYYINANVDGFATETVELQEVTENVLLEQLSLKNVVTPEVKILSCKETTKDGMKVLDLDFSSTLDTFMNNVGSSAEYYVVGSICNTFLEAYGAEQIKITVEGGLFETGHSEYPSYMSKFTE